MGRSDEASGLHGRTERGTARHSTEWEGLVVVAHTTPHHGCLTPESIETVSSHHGLWFANHRALFSSQHLDTRSLH